MSKPFTGIGMTDKQIKKFVSVYYFSYRKECLTERIAELIAGELKKAQENGRSIDEALHYWDKLGWSRFEADFLEQKNVQELRESRARGEI